MAGDTRVDRPNGQKNRNQLSVEERKEFLKPYLPVSPKNKQVNDTRSKPVRGFLKNQFHLFVFTTIHLLFSLYIRLRQTYHVIFDRIIAILYYHHRSPELIKQDVRSLNKVPQHLSVILDLKREDQGQASLETLMDEVAEIAAWSTCVGIPMLSVYEKTGILKQYMPSLHRIVSSRLHSYFGNQVPTLQIGAPNISSYLNGNTAVRGNHSNPPGHLSMLLLSAEDGRATLVDLTKTLAEMSQRKKLSPDDITQELVDAEIMESVMGEPDLLVLFGPDVHLQGYPPWQIRLSEIYHVQDNNGVSYKVFLRALHSYAKAHMRFGR